MQCLAQTPYLMARIDKAERQSEDNSFLLDRLKLEAVTLQTEITSAIETLRVRLVNIHEVSVERPWILHAHYTRMYTFGLAIGIIINCIVGHMVDDKAETREKSSHYAQQIVEMAEAVRPYRPLGTLWMGLCLAMAWVGAPDETRRSEVEDLFVDYQRDLSGSDMRRSLNRVRHNPFFKKQCQRGGIRGAVMGMNC